MCVQRRGLTKIKLTIFLCAFLNMWEITFICQIILKCLDSLQFWLCFFLFLFFKYDIFFFVIFHNCWYLHPLEGIFWRFVFSTGRYICIAENKNVFDCEFILYWLHINVDLRYQIIECHSIAGNYVCMYIWIETLKFEEIIIFCSCLKEFAIVCLGGSYGIFIGLLS